MNKLNSKQDGAILIVTLIILMLLTALATSSFQSSTMQERMAAASAQHSVAFQTAESAIEEILNDTSYFETVSVSSTDLTITSTFNTDSKVIANATITQKDLTHANGFSVTQGSGFVSYVFEVTGRGAMQRNDASTVSESTVIQGVQWTAPN